MKETRLVKNMTKVYESQGGTKVYVSKTINKKNLMNEIKVIAIDNEFNSSNPIIFRNSDDVIDKVNYFSDIADFTAKDVQEIGKSIISNINNIRRIDTKGRMNIREVFKVLYDELSCNSYVESELKENQYIISNLYFNEIVTGCDWSAIEVKRKLVEADMLKVGKGRTYDFNKRINGKNKWLLSIDAEALKEEANISNKEVGEE